MPIWSIPRESADEVQPADKTPQPLQDWSVLELPTGARHLCGCVFGHGWREGRVTSAVASWDHLNATGTTGSGRRYQLIGRPGGNLDTDYVRNAWVARQGVGEPTEATPEVWAAIEAARPPEVVLTAWQLIRTDERRTYAAGLHEQAGQLVGIVTPEVHGFSYDRMRFRTAAGHPYRLDGEPGSNAEVTHVLEGWLRANGVDDWDDVTAEHWAQVEQRRQPGPPDASAA